MFIKTIIKKILSILGYKLIPLYRDPEETFLGLNSRPIDSIIDIGANIGQFAKKARSKFPNASIYCFEPLPDVFEILNNWADSDSGKVKTFNTALGECTGKEKMFRHKNHSPSSSLLETTALSEHLYPQTRQQEEVEIQIKKLDDFLENGEIDLSGNVLIKMDVQGVEDQVIRGGEKVLRLSSGCILEISLDRLYDGQANFIELIQTMDSLGFCYAGNLTQAYAADGHVVFIDALFIRK